MRRLPPFRRPWLRRLRPLRPWHRRPFVGPRWGCWSLGVFVPLLALGLTILAMRACVF